MSDSVKDPFCGTGIFMPDRGGMSVKIVEDAPRNLGKYKKILPVLSGASTVKPKAIIDKRPVEQGPVPKSAITEEMASLLKGFLEKKVELEKALAEEKVENAVLSKIVARQQMEIERLKGAK